MIIFCAAVDFYEKCDTIDQRKTKNIIVVVFGF